MRAKLIIPSDGPNPDYNPQLPESSTNFRDIKYPVGTVLVGPKCWIHCVPDQSGVVGRPGIIRAEPDDDECRAKVAEHYRRVAPLMAARELGALKRSEQNFESETL